MIHELRWYDLFAGRTADYVAVATVGRSIRGDGYGKLEGHWTPLSGGVDRIIHMWSYEDLAERDRLRGLLAGDVRWNEEFLPHLPPLVRTQDNKILSPIRGLQPPNASMRYVYELRTERLRLRAVRPWLDGFVPLVSALEAHGGSCVGIWQTVIGSLNEVVHLWAYPSTEALLTARRARSTEGRWRDFLTAAAPLTIASQSDWLVATPLSPME